MVGVTLVAFASIFAAERARRRSDDAVEQRLAARSSSSRTPTASRRSRREARAGASAQVARRAARSRRCASSQAQGRRRQGRQRHGRRPGDASPTLYRVELEQGSDALARPRARASAVVAKGYADDHDIKVGDALRVHDADRARRSRCASPGIVDDKGHLHRRPHGRQRRSSQRDFGATQGQLRASSASTPAPTPRRSRRASSALLERDFPQAEALTNAGVHRRPGRPDRPAARR